MSGVKERKNDAKYPPTNFPQFLCKVRESEREKRNREKKREERVRERGSVSVCE